MSDTERGPSYRVSYTRPIEPCPDMPSGGAVYCGEDDERATRCIIEISRQEFEFGRSDFDPKRWDIGRDRLERALKTAFDQGRAEQRQIIRDALGLPTNWGGAMHGRSGN